MRIDASKFCVYRRRAAATVQNKIISSNNSTPSRSPSVRRAQSKMWKLREWRRFNHRQLNSPSLQCLASFATASDSLNLFHLCARTGISLSLCHRRHLTPDWPRWITSNALLSVERRAELLLLNDKPISAGGRQQRFARRPSI